MQKQKWVITFMICKEYIDMAQDTLWQFNEDHIADAYTQQIVDAVLALCSQEHNTGYDWTLIQTLAQRAQFLITTLEEICETVPDLSGLDKPTEFAVSDARQWCIARNRTKARNAITKVGDTK